MYTAIYVQCRAGATAAARADSDKDSSILKLKTTISGYDIEAAFFDIDKLRYRDTPMSKKNASISEFLRYRSASISKS